MHDDFRDLLDAFLSRDVRFIVVGAPHPHKVDADRAKDVLDGIPGFSARDALHVAVMRLRETTGRAAPSSETTAHDRSVSAGQGA